MNIKDVHHDSMLYHHDQRGWLCEIWKKIPTQKVDAAQVNVMLSEPETMRGSHIHREHTDILFIASGRAVIGMRDVRKHSKTFGKVDLLEFKSGIFIIPPGIIHGLYFPVESVLVTVESMLYDPEEELKVDCFDEQLEIQWPSQVDPSQRPETGTFSFDSLMKRIEPWQRLWKL